MCECHPHGIHHAMKEHPEYTELSVPKHKLLDGADIAKYRRAYEALIQGRIFRQLNQQIMDHFVFRDEKYFLMDASAIPSKILKTVVNHAMEYTPFTILQEGQLLRVSITDEDVDFERESESDRQE